MTHIEGTGSAGPLGNPGRDDGGVSALRDVSVPRLPVLGSLGPSVGVLPAGHVVPSLGLAEQVEPTEVGPRSVLVDVGQALGQSHRGLLLRHLGGRPRPLVVPHALHAGQGGRGGVLGGEAGESVVGPVSLLLRGLPLGLFPSGVSTGHCERLKVEQ